MSIQVCGQIVISGSQDLCVRSNTAICGTGAMRVPFGNTAQRPGTPVAGGMRFNSQVCRYEVYTGTAWQYVSLAPTFRCPVYAWGINTCGQLGDNSLTLRSVPTSFAGCLYNWCAVSAGCRHAIALRCDGRIWAWGRNDLGAVGDGTTTTRSSPVSVVGGFSDWTQISAGQYHNLAIRVSGVCCRIYAWGWNVSGQLGDGSLTNKCSPVLLAGHGLCCDWRAISAGGRHSLGIRAGCAYGWGFNNCGQIGDNSLTTKCSPSLVVGGFTNWCIVSAGYDHSLGARCSPCPGYGWGRNTYGQLGIGLTTTRCSPSALNVGASSWRSLGAGYRHSAGIISNNGCLYSWGLSTCAANGNAFGNCTSTPVAIASATYGESCGWCRVFVGSCISLALSCSRQLYVWGTRACGASGIDPVPPPSGASSNPRPIPVDGAFNRWITGAAGHNFATGIFEELCP